MDRASLLKIFDDTFSLPILGEGYDALARFLRSDALIIGDGQPRVLSRAQFLETLEFEMPLWESLSVRHYSRGAVVEGKTGIVTSYYTLRGKPADAGFRLRHGVCSVSCAYSSSGGTWEAFSMVLGPLLSHIHGASPT